MSFDDTMDAFKVMKEAKAERNAEQKVVSTQVLVNAGVRFTSHNNGHHLQIKNKIGVTIIDFWPSTGKWKSRGVQDFNGQPTVAKYGNGLHTLMQFYHRVTGLNMVTAAEHSHWHKNTVRHSDER